MLDMFVLLSGVELKLQPHRQNIKDVWKQGLEEKIWSYQAVRGNLCV
jgi:hypothetical protein